MADTTGLTHQERVDADAFGGSYDIYLPDGSMTSISGSNLTMNVSDSGALLFSFIGSSPTHAYAPGQWLAVNLIPSK